MTINDELNDVRRQVKARLVDLVQMQGIAVSGRKKIRCPNPAHHDEHPSCVIYDNQDGPVIICYAAGCTLKGDIFVLHHHLTGAPLSGPGWFEHNLVPLAKMFSIELPKRDLSPRDRYLQDVRRAYVSAEQLLVTGQHSPVVQQKLTVLNWGEKVRHSLGIGSIDYTVYESRMLSFGYDREFLKKIGLLDRRLFGAHLLTFTLKDEYGDPVGFSARNLLFDQLKRDWEHTCVQFGAGSAKAQAAKNAIPPAKYFNSIQGTSERDGSPILFKGERLFGFHKAKMAPGPLYLVEGYADVTTAHQNGLVNFCSVNSGGLTIKQLELILKYKIPHIVICLDADEGGRRGLAQFLSILQKATLPPWFLAEVVFLPEGTDDPDAYLRRYGAAAFQALPRTDWFAYWVGDLVHRSSSRQDATNQVITLLMAENSPLRRFTKAQAASSSLGIPANILFGESYSRAGLPPLPVLTLRVNGAGEITCDQPLLQFFREKPIKLLDCRATIEVDPGKAQPDLMDDCIYYPIKTP